MKSTADRAIRPTSRHQRAARSVSPTTPQPLLPSANSTKYAHASGISKRRNQVGPKPCATCRAPALVIAGALAVHFASLRTRRREPPRRSSTRTPRPRRRRLGRGTLASPTQSLASRRQLATISTRRAAASGLSELRAIEARLERPTLSTEFCNSPSRGHAPPGRSYCTVAQLRSSEHAALWARTDERPCLCAPSR